MSDEDAIKLAVFIAKVSEWMETTTEYRRSLCKKMDDMNNKINGLPCAERAEASKSSKFFSGLMWTCIGGLAILIFIHLGWK